MKTFFKNAFLVSLPVLLLFGAGAALADDKILEETIDYPPFGIHDGTQAKGVGVDIFNEIANKTHLNLFPVQTFVSRLVDMSQTTSVVFPMVTRTADREASFRWIGMMAKDRYCFVTPKAAPAVSTLEEGKKLKLVAVNKGGATEKFLKDKGFENIDLSLGSSGSLRKLAGGRVDAWFGSEKILVYAGKAEKLNASDFNCTGNFAQPAYWLAASLKLPDEQFNKIKAAFDELEKSGFVRDTVQKYQN